MLWKIIKNRTGPDKIKRYAVFGLLFLCMCMMCPTFVYADKEKDNEVGQIDTIELSLYEVQTALTAYVNNVVGVNGNDKHANNRVESTSSAANEIGNAGAYVGYGDVDAGFSAYIMSNLTHGVSSSTYDAWENITVGKDGSTSNENEVYMYTRYGRLLADTGLDDTDTMNSSNGRWLIGGFLMLLYTLSECIPMMFGFALKLLQVFNPFGFLGDTASWTGYMKSAFPDAPNVLQSVVSFISHLFDIIVHDITWAAAVPILICLMLTNILLLRKKAGHEVSNFVKRILFFGVGIPICAGLYTNVVNSMYEITAHATTSSQLVVSTVVDFESWVTNSQLGVPEAGFLASMPKEKDTNADIVNGGAASEETLQRLRHTTQAINHANNEQLGEIPLMSALDYEHGMLSGNIWNKDVQTTGTEGSEAFQGLNELTTDMKTKTAVLELLWRYTNGSFYRATDFETSYMNRLTTTYRNELGHMGSSHGATSNNGTVYEMFDRTNEEKDWLERKEELNFQIWNPPSQDGTGFHMKWTTKPWNLFQDGYLMAGSMNPLDTIQFTTSDGENGLSTMSMYNYLSTSFDENSLMVYSNDKSISENSRQQHYSANIVGTGGLRIALTANMMVILAVLVVVAFVFSLKMAMQNLKRGFQLLTSIPVAMMGAVKAIAQVISYVVAMIMELITSMFLYLIVSDMLVLVAIVVESLVTGDTGGVEATFLMSVFGTESVIQSNLTLAILLETLVIISGFGFFVYYRRVWYRFRQMCSRKWYHVFTCTEMMPVYHRVIQEECVGTNQTKQHVVTWKEWVRGVQSDLGFVH